MPDPTPNTAVATVHDLADQRLDLLAKKEKLELQIADIDEALLRELPKVGGRYELPGCPGQGVKLTPAQSRFNADRARVVLTEDQLKAISALKPDAQLARRVLPGELVAACCVETNNGRPSIRGLSDRGQR